MPSKKYRPLMIKWGGVKVMDYKSTSIGRNVTFDTMYPQDIIIEKGVRIAFGSSFLTHFKQLKGKHTRGKVIIKRNAFIGCNTIVCKPVTIGENAIIGAGYVVTKNIPSNEVWAGNPAKFIKRR